MVEEGKEIINIYEINGKEKINKKKVLIILAIILIILMLIITLIYTIDYMEKYKKYKEYEAKLQQIQQETSEKQKQIKEEIERIKKERLPNLTQQGFENISSIYKSDTKRVFLTFDDGPSSITSQILDTLNAQNIKATFFVLGTRVEAMPETVQRMYKEGHYIANHGYSHIYDQIYSSPQMVLDEFNKCNEAVKKAINQPEYNSHLFRFPGGLAGGKYADIKVQAKELLNQNNIVNVDWNALIGDSEKSNASVEFLLQRMQETSSNKNSVVLLMHDAQTKSSTLEALPQIIQYFKEQGYEFKSFYDIIK